MRKTSLVVLCSIGCLTWTGPTLADENSEEKTSRVRSNELRQWCILPNEIGNVVLPQDTSDCAIIPKTVNRKLLFLLRPDEDGSRGHLSAIAEVKSNGSVILNPDGFNYGPIPDLKELTPEQADQLWARNPDKQSNSQKKTYKLLARNNQDVFLDLMFKNGRLQKYRIRGTVVKMERWSKVQ